MFDSISEKIDNQLTFLKRWILGANNERLDFVMDSFYKLEPRKKNTVLFGIVFGIVCFIAFAVSFYVSQIGSLEDKLNRSFAALHTLQEQKSEYNRVQGQFNLIVKDVSKRTQRLQMKPLMEKFARSLGVKIEGLMESEASLSADNPMGEFLHQRKIEVRFPKVSIPKLLKFLVEVEKSRKFLRVSDLTIKGIYGTKLYFDASTVIHWYRGA